MRKDKLFSAILVLSWFGMTALKANAAGTVSGAVIDDKGVPVAGATVYLSGFPAGSHLSTGRSALPTEIVASTATTGTDGTFLIAGLAPGTYSACAFGSKSTHLASCEWGQGAIRVDLSAAQDVKELKFQLEDGILVRFQVADPKQQIRDLADLQKPVAALPLSGSNFRIGVFAGTRYLPAKLVTSSATSRQYQVAISKAATVHLFLDTSLRLADSVGAAVPARQPSTPIAASGATAVTIPLSVQ